MDLTYHIFISTMAIGLFVLAIFQQYIQNKKFYKKSLKLFLFGLAFRWVFRVLVTPISGLNIILIPLCNIISNVLFILGFWNLCICCFKNEEQ